MATEEAKKILMVAAIVVIATFVVAGLAFYVSRSAILTVEISNGMDDTVFFNLVVKGESSVNGYVINHSGLTEDFQIKWLGFGHKDVEVTLEYGPLGSEQSLSRTVAMVDKASNFAYFDLE